MYRFPFGLEVNLEILNREFRTVCFINPFTVTVGEEPFAGTSFEDLFRLTKNAEKEISFPNLLEIRKQFTISEAGHPIHPEMAALLRQLSGDESRAVVRSYKDFYPVNWTASLASFLAQDDWIAYLPVSGGEFQIFDEGCSWLINARAGDFLNFLIIPNRLADSLNEACPRLFLRVAGKD